MFLMFVVGAVVVFPARRFNPRNSSPQRHDVLERNGPPLLQQRKNDGAQPPAHQQEKSHPEGRQNGIPALLNQELIRVS